jgi:glycosyltransferase involved in cell wall biosynthesis
MKRLKIFIIAPMPFFPPNDGGKICLFGFIDHLRKYHDFTVLVPLFYDELHYLNLMKLKEIWTNVNLQYWQRGDANLSPAPNRLKLLVQKAESYAKEVSWINKIVSKKHTERGPLDKLNRFSFSPQSNQLIDKITEILNKNQYDIIQVALPHYLNLVSLLSRYNAKLIFEQIESGVGVVRDYLSSNNYDAVYSKYVTDNMEIIEDTFISKYDAVFTLNKEDASDISKRCPTVKIFTSPFGVLDKEISDTSSISTTIEKLVFSGHESHYPNKDALIWYLAEIGENAFVVTGLKLYVTGIWSKKFKKTVTSKYKYVEFTGFIDHYNDFIKNSLIVVPMRIGGGGLRTKILYAMANGVPVVATSVGIFGIEATQGESVLIADTPQDFANAIEKLHSDIDLSRKISTNGMNLIKARYSQTYTSELRNKFYNEICKND